MDLTTLNIHIYSLLFLIFLWDRIATRMSCGVRCFPVFPSPDFFKLQPKAKSCKRKVEDEWERDEPYSGEMGGNNVGRAVFAPETYVD